MPNDLPLETVAVLSPGEMGHAAAAAIRETGFRVITALDGRGEASRARAEIAGMEDLGNLDAVMGEADLVLSILAPDIALEFAGRAAAAMKSAGRTPLFMDCNAVAPETAAAIAGVIAEAGATAVDGSIIGPPPGRGVATRLYVSGPDLGTVQRLEGGDLEVKPIGAEIGGASAIKMCYGGLTKGVTSLYAAVLVAGELLGVGEELQAEFAASQERHWQAMKRAIPGLAVDSGRRAGEMDEVAKTLAAVGVTANIHTGAADILRLVNASPLGAETRATRDESRTLGAALKIFAATASGR